MDKEQYQKLVKRKSPKEKRLLNAFVSFMTGGFLGIICQGISDFLIIDFGIDKQMSYSLICLGLIFIASFFTSLSFFDTWVQKLKCGLIIPTTGFAHSVSSSALEYKKDGLITGLGSNFFKLAGSVILYGIVSSFFLCILRVIING